MNRLGQALSRILLTTLTIAVVAIGAVSSKYLWVHPTSSHSAPVPSRINDAIYTLDLQSANDATIAVVQKPGDNSQPGTIAQTVPSGQNSPSRLRSSAVFPAQIATAPGFGYAPNPTVRGQTPRTAWIYESDENSKLQQLLNELRRMPKDARDEDKLSQLKQLLHGQFESKHREQTQRLQKILADAEKTKAILAQREEQKDKIVERRLTELLGERDPLNWDYGSEGNSQSSSYLSVQPAYPSQPAAPGETQYVPRTYQPNRSPSTATIPNTEWPIQSTSPPSAQYYSPGRSNNEKPNTNQRSTSPQLPQAFRSTPTSPRSNFGTSNQQSRSNGSVRRPIQEPFVTRTDESDDVIRTGYAFENAREAVERANKLFERGALSSSEMNSLRQTLNEAKARWDLTRRQLDSEIRKLKIKCESSEEQLALLRQKSTMLAELFAVGKIPQRDTIEPKIELLKVQQELELAKAELEESVQQLEWAKAFQTKLKTAEKAEVESADSNDSLLLNSVSSDEVDSAENAIDAALEPIEASDDATAEDESY